MAHDPIEVMTMLVQELMSREPVTVRPDATVKAALMLLDHHEVTSLPVVTPSGRIAGVVSEADLIRDQVSPDPRAHETPGDDPTYARSRLVADVMSPHAITVRPETDLTTVIDLATSTGIKAIPVVDENDRVVGVISRRDVVRLLARSDNVLEQEVDAFLLSTGLGPWFVDVHEGVVELTGPSDEREQSIATILARSVPGVVEVRIR